MTSLGEIKAAVAKYDKALKAFQRTPNIETMGGRNAHELLMAAHRNAAKIDHVKALLQVVEAVGLFIDNITFEDSSGEIAMYRPAEVADIEPLIDALTALRGATK